MYMHCLERTRAFVQHFQGKRALIAFTSAETIAYSQNVANDVALFIECREFLNQCNDQFGGHANNSALYS